MSPKEFPTLPETVAYIGLDGTEVNLDSPFPEVRFGNGEVVDENAQSFEHKKADLISHCEDHIRDVKNGLYDHRWPADRTGINRAKEILHFRGEISYLSQLTNDTEGKAYVDLWFHKLNPRQGQNAA